MTVDVLMS